MGWVRHLSATLVTLVSLVPAALAQPSVPPGLGIGLAEVPSALADDPRAHLYVVDAVNAGSNFERKLIVSNGTDSPMRVELYATSASVEEGWVIADGRSTNELTEWISVEPDELTIPPGERREAVASFTVPGDATGGEHYAAIVAEAPPVTQGNVELVSRAGVRVYLAVTGDPGETFTSDFEIDTLAGGRSPAGEPLVVVGVTNTGDRAIDVNGELLLRGGPGGISAGPFPVTIPRTVGPGGSGSVEVLLDPDIPAGPWLARADLASGLIERSAEATIVFPDEAGTTSEPQEATPVFRDRGVLVPLAFGLLILALFLVFLVWFLAKRRRRDEDEDGADSDEPAVGASP